MFKKILFWKWHPYIRLYDIEFGRATRGVTCRISFRTEVHTQFSWRSDTTRLCSGKTVLGAYLDGCKEVARMARELRAVPGPFNLEAA